MYARSTVHQTELNSRYGCTYNTQTWAWFAMQTPNITFGLLEMVTPSETCLSALFLCGFCVLFIFNECAIVFSTIIAYIIALDFQYIIETNNNIIYDGDISFFLLILSFSGSFVLIFIVLFGNSPKLKSLLILLATLPKQRTKFKLNWK